MGQIKKVVNKGHAKNMNSCESTAICRNTRCDRSEDCDSKSDKVKAKKTSKCKANMSSQSRLELNGNDDTQQYDSENSSSLVPCKEGMAFISKKNFERDNINNKNVTCKDASISINANDTSIQEVKIASSKVRVCEENNSRDDCAGKGVVFDPAEQGIDQDTGIKCADVVNGKPHSNCCVVSQGGKICQDCQLTFIESSFHDVSNDYHSSANSSSGTDFSRFKESTPCDTLFPSNVWSSLENDDLDLFSKHIETSLDGLNNNNNSRKRTFHHSGLEGNSFDNDKDSGDVPCKTARLELDGTESGLELETSLQQSSSSKANGSCQESQTRRSQPRTKSLQTYPKIPDDCYVALDCEMVGVGDRGSRSVLGRCSIVEYDGSVLYDNYVRPMEPITDYRTRWSGISPAHLRNAEPTWKAWQDIHKCLKNKIVIGHSVKNDFDVIEFYPHRFLVRDTTRCTLLSKMADLVQVERGNSLKSLTKRILGKEIQMGRKGHDSVEDARATLELFKVVREEWEQQLFAEWTREGIEVEECITKLIEGKDLNLYKKDACNRKKIRFDDGGSPGCGAKNDTTTNSNSPKVFVNKDSKLLVNYDTNGNGFGYQNLCCDVHDNSNRGRSSASALKDARNSIDDSGNSSRNGSGTVNSSSSRNQPEFKKRGRHSGELLRHMDFLSDEFWPSDL